MAAEPESPRGLILWTIAMVAVAIVAAWVLYLVRQVVLLLYVSGILAIGFSPLVRLIERQTLLPIGPRVPRWLAILTIYVAILGALIGIGFVVFPPLVTQARAFATHLPDIFERAQQFLLRRGILTQHVKFGEVVQQAPGSGDAVGTLLGTFWGVIGGIFGAVTILILTFYLLVDAESLFAGFIGIFPKHRRMRVHMASRQITIKVSAWLTGQLILAGTIGSTTAIGLFLLGIPYFYVLALIAAIGEMIPYVGPVLAAVPGMAVASTISWKLALGTAFFYLAQQQVEANLIVPKLMERQVGLTALGVLVALLLGGALLGVLGAMLAVPTAAILQVLAQVLMAETTEDEAQAASGESARRLP